MDILSLKVRWKRLYYMLIEKGVKYLSNFLFMVCTYNNDFIKNILLTNFYPWFVFYPRYFEIEVTTKCNLKCIMCERTYWNEKSRDLTFKEFKHIVSQFPKIKWIGTTGIGSSFLNKDYVQMLRYVKEKKIYVELFDSFNNLNERLIEDIVKEKLIGRFIASIDAATKETYEKIRVGASFENVIKNVKTLVKMKKKYKTHFPELSFHYIISKMNYSEVPQFIELIHRITSGDNVGILFTKLLHSFDEVENMVSDLPEKIKREALGISKKLGIRLMWTKDLREKRQPMSKCTEWTMPFIFADGSVIPCCAGNEANKREFQIKTRMGNILEQDFKTIWNGSKFKDLRDMLHNGETPIQCVDCPIYKKVK